MVQYSTKACFVGQLLRMFGTDTLLNEQQKNEAANYA